MSAMLICCDVPPMRSRDGMDNGRIMSGEEAQFAIALPLDVMSAGESERADLQVEFTGGQWGFMVNTRIYLDDEDWARSDGVAVFVNSTPHIPKSLSPNPMWQNKATHTCFRRVLCTGDYMGMCLDAAVSPVLLRLGVAWGAAARGRCLTVLCMLQARSAPLSLPVTTALSLCQRTCAATKVSPPSAL